VTSPTVSVTPATTLDLAALAALVTEAFSDSAAPWPLLAATLAAMVARDDIALPLSHVAYLHGAPVGVTLVAVRYGRDAEGGARARVVARTWLEALGVVSAARGSGVARLLMGRVLDEARARGSRAVTLQVHASNAPARRLYESLGFVAARRLLGFTLPRASAGRRGVSQTPVSQTPRQWAAGSGTTGITKETEAGVSVTLQPVAAPLALPLVEACLAGEPPAARPSWQMETSSLARLASPAQVYMVSPPGQKSVGYVALTTTPDDTTGATLLHIGILPESRRRGWGRAAVDMALALYPTVDSLTVPPLVPGSSTLVPFLTACGAVRAPEEHLEMSLTL